MDYSQEYKQKLVSADEAVKLIKSGDWVDYGWCNGTVDVLDQALAKRTDELKNVNLRGGILLKPLAVFAREDAGEHFTWNSWHMSGIERKLIARGCAYYSPIRYSELPRYYRESSCPDDVAMIMVAPMDKHGYFNFGQTHPISVQCVRLPNMSSWKSTKICHAASAVQNAASIFPMSHILWKETMLRSANLVQAVLPLMLIKKLPSLS